MKTKRPKTRISLAKKQLNKGVKLNTKVVFNDEGEVRYLLNEKKRLTTCKSLIKKGSAFRNIGMPGLICKFTADQTDPFPGSAASLFFVVTFGSW